LAPVLITRKPRFVLSFVITLAFICSTIISLTAFSAHAMRPTTTHAEFDEWEQACRREAEKSSGIPAEDAATPYPGNVPGQGKYLAKDRRYPCGTFTLAEMIQVYQSPDRVGCLDYGLLRRTPVIWIRLVFAEGQVEAYLALPYDVRRLFPGYQIHALYFYDRGGGYSLQNTVRWRGFTSIAAYPVCAPQGTAIPP
jgi:hypothetical protein